MVKLKGPVFSIQARGMLGDTLLYQRSRGKAIAKHIGFPVYETTYSRSLVHDIMRSVHDLWNNLQADTKEIWLDYEDWKGLKGYHSFMRLNLRQTHNAEYQIEAPPNYGYCIVGNHLVGEFTSGGAYTSPWA